MAPPATVVFAGGYTAGHLTPGFALAELLEQRFGDRCRCLFVGSEEGPEGDIVVRSGWPFWPLKSRPVARGAVVDRVAGLLTQARALSQAVGMLRRERVNLVVSLGGHASLGPAVAARLLGKPVVLVEPNRHFGLAARLESHWADLILASPLVDPAALAKRTEVLPWLPVRPRIAGMAPQGSTEGALLVLTGSKGHAAINKQMPAAAARLPGVSVRHQCGLDFSPETIRDAYASHGIDADVRSFWDDPTSLYSEVRAIVTPAGAVTLHELPFAGVPAVIVPLASAAADHQSENARAFAELTGADVLHEADLTAERLGGALTSLLSDDRAWSRAAGRMRAARESAPSGPVLDRLGQLLRL